MSGETMRDKRYQKLLNDKRWKTLRIAYLREHPLCERCQREGKAAGIPDGYVRSAVDVHHKTPVESAKTEREMELLAYSWGNLEALCIPCHIKTHKEMGKNTKANMKARADERFQRWIDSVKRLGTEQNNG